MVSTERPIPESHVIKYDLHIHSSISDGTFTPYEIIDLVRENGFHGLSISDHDDISEDHIREYAEKNNITYVPGIEFSTDIKNLHILGYNVNTGSTELQDYIKFQKSERIKAIKKMCAKTERLGIPVSFEELEQLDTLSLGRPHLARLMIRKGYVKDIYEAFQKYLKNGQPVFVDYEKYDYLKIIDIIIKSDGLPVFAHPGMLSTEVFNSVLVKALEKGLQGLEVYYPRHSVKQVTILKQVTEKYGLIVTGGSDFHGTIKPDIQIGDAGLSQEEFERFIQFL